MCHAQDPLRLLRLLCPSPHVLLLPYLALGGHDQLLQEAAEQLWRADGQIGSGCGNGGSCSGGNVCDGWEPYAAQSSPQLGRADVIRLAAQAALRSSRGDAAAKLLLLRAAPRGDPCTADARGPGAESAAADGAAAAAALAGMDELAAHCGCDGSVVSALHRLVRDGLAPQDAAAVDPPAFGAFLLPAAAMGGNISAVEAAAGQLLDELAATRQLPAALCLAGRGGHVGAVEALLRDPRISSRPLEIAALDGASRGWPAATLRPVAAAVASRYREDATRMLAGPMERAVAYGHSEAGDIIWEALVQGPPEPERYADLIVRLAAAGDYARAVWIADYAPPVMVKVGTAPAAAAAERGHERLATLMAERAARALPGGRAAAARGRLAAAAGDAAAAERLLSEITLAPGELRRDLLCHAASKGDLAMLLLLLDRLGPWMGEEVDAVASLVKNGHGRLMPALHAATAPPTTARLLRACCKLCGPWLVPEAGLMLWALRTTTNPSALDLMVGAATLSLKAVFCVS
ncbi:hypothetical protein MNEG_9684 [Monoraphidium neglectum]|uniref:Uncharacterized protein n=1 Tax=Monoraphidium neglectum TaxID=145388 RepID=A0A0D2JFN6_9CHLO|nr:hypothetical protein MNEG_9684 [Monoraphidium neglectum]KIY98277.1 hypothetical protein MNEG_9684 [Monoraphidium neglectum]|eukprot:XP_013897297.1 hypothetical protein MNEG_9684 [Monoraphidium neglectum]